MIVVISGEWPNVRLLFRGQGICRFKSCLTDQAWFAIPDRDSLSGQATPMNIANLLVKLRAVNILPIRRRSNVKVPSVEGGEAGKLEPTTQ